jgi:UDP-N-acetylmuramate--alanine ligase
MLGTAKTIYMIGIKGTGMSSLAVLLKKMGYEVTGSDSSEKFFTETQLQSNDIPYYDGFDSAHLKPKPDLIVVSTAYNERNPEFSEAKLLQIPMISYPEAVGEISKTLTSVAVCGSHGKTTTTSMLGAIMETSHETITLTGTVAEGLNTKMDKPKFFIFEADEYQNKFQYYGPANVILTNIDFDHPDYFTDLKHYKKTFQDFLTRTLDTQGYVLYNHDDALAREMMNSRAESYGFDAESTYLITDVSDDLAGYIIKKDNNELLKIRLSVYGNHNILNSAAAAIMALHLGIPPDQIQQALALFTGVKRRMEIIPSENYIIIDDYGHHPTEIIATLHAIRNKYKDAQIVTVFHPHTFTRTKALLKEFGAAFKDSDLTLVLDIYPSAREITGTIDTKEVVAEIKKNGSNVIHTPSIPEAAEYIKKNVKKGSVILTIGAGDVWKLCALIK